MHYANGAHQRSRTADAELSRSFSAAQGGAFRLGIDGRVLDDRYHGIGRVTESLLRGLGRRTDVDVVVFLRPGQHSDRFDVPGLTTGLGHTVVPLPAPLGALRQGMRWPRALSAAQVDAVVFPYHLGAALQ